MKTKIQLRTYICLTSLCLMTILLAGCGVKPSHLKDPTQKENTAFPRTYPQTATEKAPQ